MGRYVLTELAADDVRAIVGYVRQRSATAAPKVSAELRQAMRLLASFPGLGHARADLADESLRFWSVYSYLVVYRPDTTPLQIIRVLHGSRDVGSIFDTG